MDGQTKLVLFQGDSITDCGRDIVVSESLGRGYPLLVAAQLGLEQPLRCQFLNRGISGNRVVDIYARIKRDVLKLNPDVLSVLVGINDVWHEEVDRNGVDLDKFERVYDWLLAETRKANPEVQFILMAPFVLPGSVTRPYWQIFEKETALRAQAVQRLAQKYQAVFVPLQQSFDAALALAPAEHWLVDGVHPSPAGHALIAREWRKGWEKMAL